MHVRQSRRHIDGSYDLYASMGLLEQTSAPEVVEAIARVRHACLSAKVPQEAFCVIEFLSGSTTLGRHSHSDRNFPAWRETYCLAEGVCDFGARASAGGS